MEKLDPLDAAPPPSVDLLTSKEAQTYLKIIASGLRMPIPAQLDDEAAAAIHQALNHACVEASKVISQMASGSKERDVLEQTVKRVNALGSADVSRAVELIKSLYANPVELAEEVICSRAVTQDPAATMEIAKMRLFVEGAEVPLSMQELYTDRVAQREDLSYSIAVDYPHSFAGVRSRFQLFKQRYQRAYAVHHRSYWSETAHIHSKLLTLNPRIKALGSLNGLAELGTPLGLALAERSDTLMAKTAGCLSNDGLETALQDAPACSACGITLASGPPYTEAEELRIELDQALASQLQRLSGQAVQYILNQRSGDNVERFLEVVQASDLAGACRCSKRRTGWLLEADADRGERPVRLQPLLDRIAQTYPADIGEKDIDSIVQDTKRLIEESLRAAVGNSSKQPQQESFSSQ